LSTDEILASGVNMEMDELGNSIDSIMSKIDVSVSKNKSRRYAYHFMSFNSINLAVKSGPDENCKIFTLEFAKTIVEFYSTLESYPVDTSEIILGNNEYWIIGINDKGIYLLLIISKKGLEFNCIDGI
jgi:hypothetical protein